MTNTVKQQANTNTTSPQAHCSPLWYNVLWWVLTPVYRLRVWLRSRHQIDYDREVGQRFGDASYYVQQLKGKTAPVWVHAVSVGETHVAEPVIRYLLAQGVPVLVSNTTRTGAARVAKLFADTPSHMLQRIFMPVDRIKNMSKLLQTLAPQQLVLIETELWPNLLAACANLNIPVLLLNARLSPKSANGYAKVAQLTRRMLSCISHVAVQDANSVAQFVRLGLPAERASVEGSIKFDLAPPAAMMQLANNLQSQWQLANRAVWVAASTHAGEDAPLLSAHQALLDEVSDALLILVPRHPERFADVTKLAYASGLTVAVRSSNHTVTPATQVLVADTMGELWAWFAMADMAFVGGTLVDVGGHNPLEPLHFEIPVFMGPYHHNFSTIVECLQAQGALKVVANPQVLSDTMLALWRSPAKYELARQGAKLVKVQNQGSLSRQCAIVQQYLQ